MVLVVVFGIVFNMPTEEIPRMHVIFENLENFYDLPSVIIVIFGTMCALMISFPINFFQKIPKHLKIVLFPTKYNPMEYIRQIVEFAKEARINGLLALEDKLRDTEDAFLRNSLMLVVDSVEADKVKTLLETELDYLSDRHLLDTSFYAKGSAYSPAFGMIGTLVGLINLLKQLDDPSAIAPAMAVALVTTFYGSLLSNAFFAPIANKLKIRHEEEYLCKMIISEGVQAIQAGDNPKFIEEKLTQLLPSSIAARSGEGGGKKAKSGRAAKSNKK